MTRWCVTKRSSERSLTLRADRLARLAWKLCRLMGRHLRHLLDQPVAEQTVGDRGSVGPRNSPMKPKAGMPPNTRAAPPPAAGCRPADEIGLEHVVHAADDEHAPDAEEHRHAVVALPGQPGDCRDQRGTMMKLQAKVSRPSTSAPGIPAMRNRCRPESPVPRGPDHPLTTRCTVPATSSR